MPYCNSCGFGYSLDKSEIECGKVIKVHCKPCKKCGNTNVSVGKKDRSKARALCNSPPSVKVVINPGGELGTSMQMFAHWLTTSEKQVAKDLVLALTEAKGDPDIIIRSICAAKGALLNIQDAAKVKEDIPNKELDEPVDGEVPNG